jgi:hypothetical protein
MELTSHGAKARALKLVKLLFKAPYVRLKTVFSGLVERWVRGYSLYLHYGSMAIGRILYGKNIPLFEHMLGKEDRAKWEEIKQRLKTKEQ